MTYFSNRTINYLNLHLALAALLDQSYLVFLPIYFYTHGFSIMEVLLLLALLNMLRIPLRFLCLPIVHRWGLKAAVMMGAAGYGLSFPLLTQVTGWNGWLMLYVLVCSGSNALHWFALHVFYSLAGEHEHRGRQVAVSLALTAGFAAIAPLLSAVVIAAGGYRPYFILMAALVPLMLLTLKRCEDIAVSRATWREGRKAAFTLGARIQFTEASIVYPLNICWLFALYLYVGEIMSLGAIVTFGVVIQILYQLLLGAWVDRGRGALVVHMAVSLRIVTALGRALLPLSVPAVLCLEASNAAAGVHVGAVEPTAMYNAAKQSPQPLWFWLFAEAGWDIGTLVGAGGAALLLACGMELRHVVLFALPFIFVLWQLLHGYFRKHPYVRPST